MTGNKLQVLVDAFREFATQKGWLILEEKAIQSGYQLTVTDNKTRVPVAFFQSGKMLVQGKAGALQSEIKQWSPHYRTQSDLWQDTPLSVTPQQAAQVKPTAITRIGSDESGKGDYFGPLVVAAVYVNAQTESQLVTLKVRDSKTIPDNIILYLAEEIKSICSGQTIVHRYFPERYNALYEHYGNLNVLLVEAHAEAICNLQKNVACEYAIVDQFGNESLVRNALTKLGCTIKVEQRPRAEDDIAVAAASIIARAEFVRAIHQLSESISIHLPKGASDPRIVTVGREIVAKYGQNELAKVAKVHFQTTKAILQG